MMICGWFAGTILLILRILCMKDFRLMTVNLYEIPSKVFERLSLKRIHEERVEAPIPTKKKKISYNFPSCCRKKHNEE